MRAMVLEKIGEPLVLKEVQKPSPSPFEMRLKVEACGVCRTDLHIVDGELPSPLLPLILGHQIVGVVDELGQGVKKYQIGERVGVPWLGGTCQFCEFCLSGRENLCDLPLFTGYQKDGGYAEYCVAHEEYALKLPEGFDALTLAPLLCAGLIGYRAFKLAGDGQSLGFYGFGSSAHILVQIATALGRQIYAFTRTKDTKTQDFAKSLGATWAGSSDEMPPKLLDAAIIFAASGTLYPQALKAVKKGGRVISAGIYMSDIPSFPYNLLWQERSISSVANLTRQDGIDFMQLIQKIPLKIQTKIFTLEEANMALETIRKGSAHGSCVLKI